VIFELDLIKKKLAAQHEKLASIEKDLKNKMDYDYELKIEELKQKNQKPNGEVPVSH